MLPAQDGAERPPAGLARGVWAVPRWAVAGAGLFVAAGAVAWLLARRRRRRFEGRHDSLAPPRSSRR